MSMLQELLNLGLVEIGSDDSRFEKMQSAASALAKRFGEEPALLVPATLVALDEGVDEDDPFLVLVEEMVTAEWKTLRNTHTNRPRQLLRSIAIDALAMTSAESAEISSIIWNTAASPVRHHQIRFGKAAGLIEQLLRRACERAEAEAVKRAGMLRPSKSKGKKPSIDPVALKFSAKIKDEEVLTDVARAAGPHNSQGQSYPDPNPHWSNSGGNWSYEFTPRMAAALAKSVNLGTARLGESISKDLAAHLASLEKHLLNQLNGVEQLQADLERSNASSRMRLDVLWWSEARYSSSLKMGYRDLALPLGALVAAVDLAAIVPPLAPASVSYVLAEMVADISRGAESNQLILPIEDYLKLFSEAQLDFGDALPRETNEGRVPLLKLVAEAAAGAAVSSDIVRFRTGIDPGLKVCPADFAMWMFREIQAGRMVRELA